MAGVAMRRFFEVDCHVRSACVGQFAATLRYFRESGLFVTLQVYITSTDAAGVLLQKSDGVRTR